ncbi:lig1 [Symbiodinium pilosum]|uniref:Lig1 protein n=1 Tax=Symbiodinium pilosum TaxID=2952 RepID=A0A812TJJ8_SYMPI|nr:lig1 [Symbiodinium pilosum]
MLESLPLTELPKEKIRAAVIRVDERISQEVWRSILQFIYQGTILQEQCTYLQDVAKCFELLFAVLLFRLPEPLLRLAQHSLFLLLPVSNPTWALQVFQLCSEKQHFENQELNPIRDAAAWVLLHSAPNLFQSMDAKNVCETLEKVVQSIERSVFDRPRSMPQPTQPAAVAKQDLLANSLQAVPQDMLAASMRGVPQEPTYAPRRAFHRPPLSDAVRPPSMCALMRSRPSVIGSASDVRIKKNAQEDGSYFVIYVLWIVQIWHPALRRRFPKDLRPVWGQLGFQTGRASSVLRVGAIRVQAGRLIVKMMTDKGSLNSPAPACIDLDDDSQGVEVQEDKAGMTFRLFIGDSEDPAQESCEACGGPLPGEPQRSGLVVSETGHSGGLVGTASGQGSTHFLMQLMPGRGKRAKSSPQQLTPAQQAILLRSLLATCNGSPDPPLPPPPEPPPGEPAAATASHAEASTWSASVAATAMAMGCGDFKPDSMAGCNLVEAACYLFAPAKDAQAGGHRLRPDWVEGGHATVPCMLVMTVEASAAPAKNLFTGFTAGGNRRLEGQMRLLSNALIRFQLNKGLYNELHEIGEASVSVALALRERGGKQRLLRAPPPLTVRCRANGVEKAKTTRLVGLLRAGVSLESSVLPALGAAAAMAAGALTRNMITRDPRPIADPRQLSNKGLMSTREHCEHKALLRHERSPHRAAEWSCRRHGTGRGQPQRSVASDGKGAAPQTLGAIAESAGLNQRYVEEILAILACSKIVNLSEESPPRYHISEETKSALDGMGLYFEELPLLTRCAFDEVVEATRRGGGVPPDRYGPFGAWMGTLADGKHEKLLVPKLLPSLAGGEIVKKLEAGKAKVLDLGCGEGTAPCLIAKHFPNAQVFGIDAWAPSVEAARKKAAASSLPNATFVCGDAADFGDNGNWTGQFDLVTSFDVIHDLTKPEATLRECKRVLKADGYFAMVDIRAETGVAKNIAHPMAPFLYAISLMHCMPQGMNDGGPGLGMMWGREKALSLLKDAGFLPEVIEMEFDTFNDCYLCRPMPSKCASADAVRSAQEEAWSASSCEMGEHSIVRHGYALRPDVRALVEALLEDGIQGVKRRCTLTMGVPMQPMLAKATTTILELLKRILGSMPQKVGGPAMLSAEFKCLGEWYDGQRAQIHILPDSSVKIFSRKLDDMTYKYPDVVKAILRSSRVQKPCVLDAEIVAVVPKDKKADAANQGEEGGAEPERKDAGKVEIAAFQSLSTRKRKNVTEANAATSSVAVKVFLFDLLFLGEEPLISHPFQQRRAKMRESFAEVEDMVAYAEAEDLEGVPERAEAILEAALRRSVAMSCEGLMVKHLDSAYEPSTKRSDCWLKLKKDYVESMGDSLDLIPIGGWRGSGRKSRWVSPWLLATYDPEEGTLGSVCRVMSGFSDKFYKENTIRYLGRELEVRKAAEEQEAAGGRD